MENLIIGILHIFTTEFYFFQFRSWNLILTNEGHDQDVFLKGDHLWTTNACLLQTIGE